VDIDLGLEELAKLLTNLGLEVEGIRLVGLEIPQPNTEDKPTSEPLRTSSRSRVFLACQ